MTRFPIWFNDSMSVAEVRALINAAGLHLHADNLGRWVVDPVPGILRKDPATNVIPLRKKRAT